MNSSLSVILLLACMSCLAQCTFDFSDSAVLSRLFRDVNILASDSFSGRKSGSEGEQKASRFITQSFQEAGLSAHGTGDSSFLQPFLISSVRIPRSSNTMKIAGRDEPVYAQYGFSPTAYSENGSMEGNSYTMIDLGRFMQPVQIKPGEIGLRVREAVRFALQQGNSAIILYNESKLNGFEKDSLYDRLQVKPEQGLVISVNSEIAGYLRGLMHNAALKGKAGFRKVSGWSNFWANFKIVMVGIDHLLVVGPDE